MGNDARRVLLVLACVALAGPGQAFQNLFYCFRGETLKTALASTEINFLYGDLYIYGCPPPVASYAALLAARFNRTAFTNLALIYMSAEPPLQRSHFTGLTLSKLTIRYTYSASRNYTTPDFSFLGAVTSVTVRLHGVNLPPLPQTARMERVELLFGQSLGAWGGCSNLRELELNQWDVERVPERWLRHCSKLTSLTISSAHQLTSQALERALGGANLQRLDLSGNSLRNISTWRDRLLSCSLAKQICAEGRGLLDLADNNVSGADAAAAMELFAQPGRRVRVARNPLRCNCENRVLLTALHEHHTQVEDYVNVTCSEDGVELALREVPAVLAELCKRQEKEHSWFTLALAGSAALVGFAVLAAGLHYRYGRIVAVFISSHGWCLNCVREEQLDPDRPFDAFVSFAHADYGFVSQHLLPELESAPHEYRLCIHTRDWVPGEPILAQIARSGRLSRRTIIVLSRNFLQSPGLQEFRMAHVSALREGRVRVVVVVLDDVLDEADLDPELHTYLRTHTYVQWGDAWFWRKLRYALPHRSSRARRTGGAHAAARAGTRHRDPGIELQALPERVIGIDQNEHSPI